MPLEKTTPPNWDKGQPRKHDELHVAAHFARAIDRGGTISSVAKKGVRFPEVSLGGDGNIIYEEGRSLKGDTLFRRYSKIAFELREFQRAVASLSQARTAWGGPIRFPGGFLPAERPKRGRPTKNRRR